MNTLSHYIQASELITQTTELMEKPHELEMSVNADDIICVIGPRAGGKSTLIRTLVGLLPSVSGKIHFFNQAINELNTAEWQALRRRLVYISSETSLLSDKNALHNVMLPALYHNLGSRGDIRARAKRLIHNLDPGLLLAKLVPYLSLEQRCKLVICRGLILEPEVICLDEAFKGLHHLSIDDLEEFLIQHMRSKKMALIVGTHNMNFVRKYANKIIFVSRTTLETFDSFEELKQSQLPAIQGFLSRSQD